VLACNVSRIGTLLEINAKVVNAFTGPLFGIFLLAMFNARARSEGVVIAGLVGAFAAYYVAYQTMIGFMWPSTFGLAATLVAGYVLTLLRPAAATAKGHDLTWWAVMRRPAAL
jgi:ABC-type microcin C transport system permease subunit YejB